MIEDSYMFGPFYFAQHMCFLSVNFLINFNREQVNKQVIFTHLFSNKKFASIT